MFLDLAMAGIQIAMFTLKLLDRFKPSWWVVFLPTILWVVIGILLRATNESGD